MAAVEMNTSLADIGCCSGGDAGFGGGHYVGDAMFATGGGLRGLGRRAGGCWLRELGG